MNMKVIPKNTASSPCLTVGQLRAGIVGLPDNCEVHFKIPHWVGGGGDVLQICDVTDVVDDGPDASLVMFIIKNIILSRPQPKIDKDGCVMPFWEPT